MRQKTREDMVREFHLPVGMVDNEWTDDVILLRIKLIEEECAEVIEELRAVLINNYYTKSPPPNKAALLKELSDLQYVLSGTAVQLGLPLQEALVRVHESNMSKYVDGKAVRREDGKILKGPDYKPPTLKDLFKEV